MERSIGSRMELKGGWRQMCLAKLAKAVKWEDVALWLALFFILSELISSMILDGTSVDGLLQSSSLVLGVLTVRFLVVTARKSQIFHSVN